MTTPVDMPRRLAAEIEAHPERTRLAALAFDVLSRQAEGRVLFAGREYVETRATHHGVTRELAEMPSANLLSVLERGPATDLERALVTALAVRGFGDALPGGADGEPALARFVRHADWLETASPYTPYALVDRVLAPDVAGRVHEAVADAILAEKGDSHGGRARNAVRIGALAVSTADSAVRARSRVAASLRDPAARALMTALCPDEAGATSAGPTLEGRLLPSPPRGGVLGFLRLVTGVALFVWLLRGLGALLGIRTHGELVLGPREIRFARRVELLGRLAFESTERIPRGSIVTASRSIRYPRMHLLVGAITLGLGVLAGSLVLADGLVSGDTLVLLVGATLLLVGAALDLGISVLLPASRGEVCLELELPTRRQVRLVGVPIERADEWLDALASA